MYDDGEGREVSSDLDMQRRDESWYAVQTRVHREKIVEYRLRSQGLSTFLPVTREVHRWSDRRKLVDVPLFATYIFVRLRMNYKSRLQVLQVDGIVGFVGSSGQGTPIPTTEIEAVQVVVAKNIPWSAHPFLNIGERVRIHGGALNGIEGTLLACDRGDTLVLSVEVLGRSLAVSVAGYEIEPLPCGSPRRHLAPMTTDRYLPPGQSASA